MLRTASPMNPASVSSAPATAAGTPPPVAEALQLARATDTAALMRSAAAVRDASTGARISYSRKLFLPLTQLCRDVCHYCTFARTPRRLHAPYMSMDEVLRQAERGAVLGCKEALFTLGEKPELRYRTAREALREMGFASTLEYVAHAAERVLSETGLLPHINAGNMDDAELEMLRPVSASMGLMLESASPRLCEPGMPHHGSPDKQPQVRLAAIARAGAHRVPFTSGILIGIGETRRERVESLLALRELHEVHGHLQEIIVQNFRAKPGTRMAAHPEPELEELLWTIAVARLIFPASTAIQAPPNLSPGVLEQLVGAGISDWGGVSPLTPDYVNPEAPWPELERLEEETAAAGKSLCERLTVYPAYVHEPERWLDPAIRPRVLRLADSGGLARNEDWCPGAAVEPPAEVVQALRQLPLPAQVSTRVKRAVAGAEAGHPPAEEALAELFYARGADFRYLCQAADALRAELHGNRVSYVVNRNINYTNICYFKCRFCAFSKGRGAEDLRGAPYRIDAAEIDRRVREAWERGATEVCLQGGIHPEYTGDTYLEICRTVRRAAPDMHIHAFSPLEVSQGAETLGLDVPGFLSMLKSEGLATLPGTAAEILDDEVRAQICPDKLNTAAWLEVMQSAHALGIRSTATIMFGHVETPLHWARHLLRLRAQQERSGGFSEFVPLPFVPLEAPMFRRGASRFGPTFREAVLMHAVARLVLYPQITNIQASWVKLGEAGLSACLRAGANDAGGTLMNESITRAAGATHGQEMPPQRMEQMIRALGREPWQRTTLYAEAPAARQRASFAAAPLQPLVFAPVPALQLGEA